MKLRVFIVCFTILFGYLVLRFTVGFLALNVDEFSGKWARADQSYYASMTVLTDGDYCLCPAYECETLIEAATLAQPTVWGWRSFTYFRDPALAPAEEAAVGRPIYAGAKVELCLSKDAGDVLELSLVPVGAGLELRVR